MPRQEAKRTTSHVVRLTNSNSKGLQVLSVMPNPFESDLQLVVLSDKSQSLSFQMMDMTGREVYRAVKTVNTGNNAVMMSSLSHLPKGLYVVRVMDNKEVLFTGRVNKVR